MLFNIDVTMLGEVTRKVGLHDWKYADDAQLAIPKTPIRCQGGSGKAKPWLGSGGGLSQGERVKIES